MNCELVEKLDKVTGSSNKADAKIAGMTPAVLTFKVGKKIHHHTFCFPFVF